MPSRPDHDHVWLDQPLRQVIQVRLVVGVFHHGHGHDSLLQNNMKLLIFWKAKEIGSSLDLTCLLSFQHNSNGQNLWKGKD